MKHKNQIFEEFVKYAATEKWWDLMTEDQQKRYLALHPDSDLRLNPKTKAQKTHESLKNFPSHILEHLEVLHPGIRGWAANQIMGPNLKGLWKSVNKRLADNPHDLSLHKEKDDLLREIKKEVRSKRRDLLKVNDWAISSSPDINALDLSTALGHAQSWKESQKEIEKQLTKHDDGRKIPMRDDLYAIKLQKPKELKQEGAEMTHCVGSYCSSVRRGDTHIYSIRMQSSDEPIATLEIDPNGIVRQIKGKSNKAVERQFGDSIKEWLDQNNFNYNSNNDYRRMMGNNDVQTTIDSNDDQNKYEKPFEERDDRETKSEHEMDREQYELEQKRKTPIDRNWLEKRLEQAESGKGKKELREHLSSQIESTLSRTTGWTLNDALRFMQSRLQMRDTDKVDSRGRPKKIISYRNLISSMPQNIASDFYEFAAKNDLASKIRSPNLNNSIIETANLRPEIFDLIISAEKRKVKNGIEQYDKDHPGMHARRNWERTRHLDNLGDAIKRMGRGNPHISDEQREDIFKFLDETGIDSNRFKINKIQQFNNLVKNEKLTDGEIVELGEAMSDLQDKAGSYLSNSEKVHITNKFLTPAFFDKVIDQRALGLMSKILDYRPDLSSQEIDHAVELISNQNDDKAKRIKKNLIRRGDKISPSQLKKLMFNNDVADPDVDVQVFSNKKVDRNDLKSYLKSIAEQSFLKNETEDGDRFNGEFVFGTTSIGNIVRRKDYDYDLADTILFDDSKNPLSLELHNIQSAARELINAGGLTAEQALKFKNSKSEALREAIVQYRRVPYEMIKDMENDESPEVKASVRARKDRALKDQFKKNIDKYKKDQEKLTEFQKYLENAGHKYSGIIQREFNILKN